MFLKTDIKRKDINRVLLNKKKHNLPIEKKVKSIQEEEIIAPVPEEPEIVVKKRKKKESTEITDIINQD